jgi:hypothetical protein
MPRPKRSSKKATKRRRILFALAAAMVIAISLTAYFVVSKFDTSKTPANKPIILYVNQGNGIVNESNFGALISFSVSQKFNTIFFQVYRSGVLLFNSSQLTYFVSTAHAAKLKLFFALYFTESNQSIPSTIYHVGEDGISLDMSTLDPPAQSALLSTLSSNFGGLTAVTTTDFSSTLSPDWLILETYGQGYDQYIHSGIIASVGVFTTTSKEQYQQEFDYALSNSNGVMVFDYAGLSSRGY